MIMAVHYYEPVVAPLEYDVPIEDEALEGEISNKLSHAEERLTKRMREIELQEDRSWARARRRNIGIFYEIE